MCKISILFSFFLTLNSILKEYFTKKNPCDARHLNSDLICVVILNSAGED